MQNNPDAAGPETNPPDDSFNGDRSMDCIGKLKAYKNAFLVLLAIFWLSGILYILGFSYSNIFLHLSSPGTAAEYGVDFKNYYGIALMLKEGNSAIYRTEMNSPYLLKISQMVRPGNITSPPSFYFMMIPWTFLSVEKAAFAWMWLKIPVLIIIAILLSFYIFRDEKKSLIKYAGALVLFISLFVFSPVLDDITYGQVNIFLLLGFLAALIFCEKGKPIPAGIILGIIFGVKFASALFILYFLLKKEWKTALSALATLLAINLTVLLKFGPGIYLDYIAYLPQVTRNSAISKLNLSFISRIYGILAGSGGENPSALAWSKGLFLILSLAIIGTVFHYLLNNKGRENTGLDFSILIIATVLISPIVWSYHQVLLFIPFACMLRQILYGTWNGKTLTLNIATLATTYFSFFLFFGMAGVKIAYYLRLSFILSGIPLLLLLWLSFVLILDRTKLRNDILSGPVQFPTPNTGAV